MKSRFISVKTIVVCFVLCSLALAQDLASFEKRTTVKKLANGLTLVICENVGVIALVARPDKPAIERRQDKVRGLPIFLRATAKHEIKSRPSGLIEREEGITQYRLPIWLDRIEERTSVEPSEMIKEGQRVRRTVGSAITGAQGRTHSDALFAARRCRISSRIYSA